MNNKMNRKEKQAKKRAEIKISFYAGASKGKFKDFKVDT